MELPIDHFRLLGVSPAVEADAVLRALQLRLDRAPEQGFTYSALTRRAEILRASADLLADSSRREEYEKSLLEGTAVIELPSNQEVAGLILLLEADAAFEAFKLAVHRLQPPQSPALGSGREADLTLIAAIACNSAALQEQESRHYEAAAALLQEGVQLLQRMGKLPDQRFQLEENLQELLPYRILDLLSRDLGDQSFHQEGLRLLDRFVNKRGGIEGKSSAKFTGGLDQSEFELFFKQIRQFLTVQEQIDIFGRWKQGGSGDAGFLRVIALTAAGFSWRKPERLQEARKLLGRLNIKGLDPLPLLGCLDLLLAEVDLSEERFKKSTDPGLRDWFENYPGDYLAAACEYCRDWLSKDVLPGYRDLDPESIDLEAWFADRDVQAFVERQDKRRGHLGLVKDKAFSFISSLSNEEIPLESSYEDSGKSSERIDAYQEIDSLDESPKEDKFKNKKQTLKDASGLSELNISALRLFISSFTSSHKRSIKISSALVILMTFLTAMSLFQLRSKQESQKLESAEDILENKSVDKTKEESVDISLEKKQQLLPSTWVVAPLMVDQPSEIQLRNLLEAWLASKAAILAGGSSEALPNVARKPLVKRVLEERKKDLRKGELQKIQANINRIKVVGRKSTRIELKARLSYRDQRLSSSGQVISETSFPSLMVTYIFGKDGNYWRLHEYISGK